MGIQRASGILTLTSAQTGENITLEGQMWHETDTEKIKFYVGDGIVKEIG